MSIDALGLGDVSVGDVSSNCPICKTRMAVEQRGSDYFAWCVGTEAVVGVQSGWRQGCLGIDGFGDTKGAAILAARSLYDSI